MLISFTKKEKNKNKIKNGSRKRKIIILMTVTWNGINGLPHSSKHKRIEKKILIYSPRVKNSQKIRKILSKNNNKIINPRKIRNKIVIIIKYSNNK